MYTKKNNKIKKSLSKRKPRIIGDFVYPIIGTKIKLGVFLSINTIIHSMSLHINRK